MGNCGVGFAPVKKNNENFLIKLMEEGVEYTRDSFGRGSRF